MTFETMVFVATIASPIVALLVGTGQILAIYFGLREMSKANKDRAKIVNDQGLLSAEICAGLREQSAGLRELLNRTEPSM